MENIDSSNITPDVLRQLKSHVYDIIGCCQDVHRELGPGLNEYLYQEALVTQALYGFPMQGKCWDRM